MAAALQRDELTADGIPVEVNMGNGGYYEAFLMNICQNEGVICFPYSLNPAVKYPFSSIRFPPIEATKQSDLHKNMIAEVLIVKDNALHLGWFKCCIKGFRSDFCEFELLDDKDNVDFVKISAVRKPNVNRTMSMDILHVHNITIPNELREYAKQDKVHATLKSSFIKGSTLINYDADRGVLVIVSPNEESIATAKNLEEAYLSALAQKFLVLQLTENRSKKSTITKSGDRFAVEFTIPEGFIGASLGHGKVNLCRAKQITGISNVKLYRSSNKFVIEGESQEAVNEARKLLEIKIEYYPIPKIFMSQFVGRESKNIYSIMKATGTLRMFVAKAEEVPESVIIKEDDVILAIVGFKDAVQKAKLFVEFQIAHIHEIQRLRVTKHEIHDKMISYCKSRSKLTSNSFSTPTNDMKQDSEISENEEHAIPITETHKSDSDLDSAAGWTNLDFPSLDIPASIEELSEEFVISDDGVSSSLSRQGGSRSDYEANEEILAKKNN